MDIIDLRERSKWFPIMLLRKIEENAYCENADVRLGHNFVILFGTPEFVLLFRKQSLPFLYAVVVLKVC